MNIQSNCELPDMEELKKQIMLTIDVAWANKLDADTIDNWLSNFTGEALNSIELERNLAMWLLYNFVYYNEDEIKHLCKLMLRKYVHKLLPDNSDHFSLDEITMLINNSRFLCIGNNSESGAYILYLFRQENELPINFFKNQDDTFKETENIVFIDDMTISGTQAIWRFEKIKYAGSHFIKNEIKDRFIQKLLTNEAENLEKYIKDRLTKGIIMTSDLSANISAEFIGAMNDCIIKHKELLKETQFFFNDLKFSYTTLDLIKKYKEGNLCNEGIYKLNRLLLEEYYSNEIVKGVNNLDVNKWYLLTFIASEKAIQDLSQLGIEVITCIILDEQSKAFSDTSMIFSNYNHLKEECKKMCKYYGDKIYPEHPLGYKAGEYTFGLYYTTPNNTLPIFWESSKWKPIFVRHEKNYGGVIDVFGRYI